MNIKFKMPKLGRKLTGGSMVKELLLTTIATTISIVLTFGTAHVLGQYETNKVQRLMAMTIINDIDQNLNMVKNYIETEENGTCRHLGCLISQRQLQRNLRVQKRPYLHRTLCFILERCRHYGKDDSTVLDSGHMGHRRRLTGEGFRPEEL